jgi:sulfate transport system ATP-binding protein
MSISIRSVSKRFGTFVALEDVSLDVPTGSLTGASGEAAGERHL